MLTIEEISHAGEQFDVFTKVGREYGEKYFGWFTQVDEPTLCYNGLDCIFFEKQQYLVLRWMNGGIVYCGYCDSIDFFIMLCNGASPGGIFNKY